MRASPQGTDMDTSTAMAVIVIALFCYLLPTFIAACRGHHNTMAICVLNVLAGWTLIGFLIALVWSCTATRHRVPTCD
jgi:hypothetical protein